MTAPTPPTEEPRPWTLDTLLDAVQPDMHREQVLALVQEAHDVGQRVSALEPLYRAIIQAIPDTITPGDDALRATARLADAVWPVVKAAYERVVAERDEAIRERDLAIAHDRQPYPTAEAYESACRALERHRERANQAEASGYRRAIETLRAEAAREPHDSFVDESLIFAANFLDSDFAAETELSRLRSDLNQATAVVEAAKAWFESIEMTKTQEEANLGIALHRAFRSSPSEGNTTDDHGH